MTGKPRGFATLTDKDRQREISAMGGRAVHMSGNARTWNSETARAAAKKGAEIRRQKALAKQQQGQVE